MAETRPGPRAEPGEVTVRVDHDAERRLIGAGGRGGAGASPGGAGASLACFPGRHGRGRVEATTLARAVVYPEVSGIVIDSLSARVITGGAVVDTPH